MDPDRRESGRAVMSATPGRRRSGVADVDEATVAGLLELGDRLVGMARPGEHIEVVAAKSADTEVRAFGGDVEHFVASTSCAVGVRLISDGRQGFASAGTFDDDALRSTVVDARDNARFSTVDLDVGLVEPDGLEPVATPLWDPSLSAVVAGDKIALALELERATVAAHPSVFGVESADYTDSVGAVAVVSSTGVRSGSIESNCSLVVYCLASDGGDTATGFGFSLGRGFGELRIEAAAGSAARRAAEQIGATPHPTAVVPVVLDPWVTAQLLGVVGATFSGTEATRGRSLFADRIGEVVASPIVTLVDDPTDADATGATSHDGEGLATRRNVLIEAGVASSLLHDGYSARRFGTNSNGAAVRGVRSTPSAGPQALRLLAGTTSPGTLISRVGDGLYITEVQGLHSGVNPVSGDFSAGAEGRVIRGGELAEPVREITIASTLQRMLTHVLGVGDDPTAMPLDASGLTVAIADVTVSGA
ncbi:MAG: TldD/PmbA family protein [Microthrixaceae bacterium]